MNELSRQQLKQRKFVFNVVVIFLFLALFYGFFNIQVAGRDKYYEIALDNSVRQLMQYPIRGTIRDRNGEILVDNRPSFVVSVIPRQLSAETRELLAQMLNEDAEMIREKTRGRYTFRPVIIKRDLDYQTVVKLEENRLNLPGVLVEIESKRFYREGVASPHIFGYVGEVTQTEADNNKNYSPGELVGKSGLEYKYDTNLRGVKGLQFVRVDAEGRDLGMVSLERNIEPIPGMDLYLTLDYSFQQFAESLMVDKRGAIVAIDPRNGNILAFVSKPDYDPRQLTGRILPEVWQKLQFDTLHPLYNRIIQSKYPPGSTYKLVAALAALQEGIITTRWTAYCPGYFRIGRKVVHCWNESGHGEVNILQAIKSSCNVFFLKLGLKIGLDTWADYSVKLFFGVPTAIDLPNESAGLVPTVEYFNKRYGEKGWTRGNLANLAIGQGELLTTPLQMAQFAMILATKGIVHTPHLTDYMYDETLNERHDFPTKIQYVQGISDEIYDLVRQGMHDVVNGGTGWRGSVWGIQVAGKTGTAQNPHGDDHAWFIAFAPFENPVFAIAVIVENAGGGGAIAAPIAGLCMEKFFYKKLLPRRVVKKDTLQIDSLENEMQLRIDSIHQLQVSYPDTLI